MSLCVSGYESVSQDICACGKLGTGSISSIRFSLNSFVLFASTRYKPSGQTDSGDGVQYAINAINVPADQCGAAFSQDAFLSGEEVDTVKKDLRKKKGPQRQESLPGTTAGRCHTKGQPRHNQNPLRACLAHVKGQQPCCYSCAEPTE